MNAFLDFLERIALRTWDICAVALRRDREAKKAEPERKADPLIIIPIPRSRTYCAFGLIVLGLFTLLGRTLYLQIGDADFLQKQGESRYTRTQTIDPKRGDILDRNGVVLATSQVRYIVTANPKHLRDVPNKKKAELARVLDMPLKDLTEKLRKKSQYVRLSHGNELQTAEAVKALGLPGVAIEQEMCREYPDGPVMAHVVGVTRRDDDTGQEGVELSKNKDLTGIAGARRVIRDRAGRIVKEVWVKDAEDGRDVTLSIDSRIQFAAYDALSDAIETMKAKAGSVVVADVQTGEVLALVNLPTYNPNDRSTMRLDHMRNRVLTDAFEPGSTMKPFAIAKALDLGLVGPLTTIQTAPGKLTIGDRTIGDTHDYGLLTVAEVIAKSSNVGTAKIALEISPQTLYDMYSDLGFGRAPDMGFPGASSGKLRPAKKWRPIELATISYGHGVSVSLMQLVRAYTALARNGDVIDLTLYKRDASHFVHGQPVFKPETARRMRAMMMATVERGGTASSVDVAGYSVAGKTGTAEKTKKGKYTRDVVASFVGIVPATQPRFIVAVMLDEPKKGRFGGVAATPVFNAVAQASLRTLMVSPDEKRRISGGSILSKIRY